jgi:hypothetical protein
MSKSIFEQAIRDRAYQLWKDEGQPLGRDTYFWALAQQQQLKDEGVLQDVDLDIDAEQADLEAAEARRKAAADDA